MNRREYYGQPPWMPPGATGLAPSPQFGAVPTFAYIHQGQVAAPASAGYQQPYWPPTMCYPRPAAPPLKQPQRDRRPIPIVDPVTKKHLVLDSDSRQNDSDSPTTGAKTEMAQLFAAQVAVAASNVTRDSTTASQRSAATPPHAQPHTPAAAAPAQNGLTDTGDQQQQQQQQTKTPVATPPPAPAPAPPAAMAPPPAVAAAVISQPPPVTTPSSQSALSSAPPASTPASAPAAAPAAHTDNQSVLDTERSAGSQQQQQQQKKKSGKQKMRELKQRVDSRPPAGDMDAFIDTALSPSPTQPEHRDHDHDSADVTATASSAAVATAAKSVSSDVRDCSSAPAPSSASSASSAAATPAATTTSSAPAAATAPAASAAAAAAVAAAAVTVDSQHSAPATEKRPSSVASSRPERDHHHQQQTLSTASAPALTKPAPQPQSAATTTAAAAVCHQSAEQTLATADSGESVRQLQSAEADTPPATAAATAAVIVRQSTAADSTQLTPPTSDGKVVGSDQQLPEESASADTTTAAAAAAEAEQGAGVKVNGATVEPDNDDGTADTAATPPPATATSSLPSHMEQLLTELRSVGESRKYYDREALLKLQKHPLSIRRPADIPNLSIVRQHGSGARYLAERSRSVGPMTSMLDQGARSHTKLRARGSHQGRRDAGAPPQHLLPPRRMEIVLNREVKLQSTENAWKVSAKSSQDLDDTEKLWRSFRGILNKITPSNISKHVDAIKQMSSGLETYDQMVGVIDILFDKALTEPAYAELYARVCHGLSEVKVSHTNDKGVESETDARKILLNRCQKEFEQDKRGKLNEQERCKQINAEPNETVRKQKRAELDEELRKIRLRSNGNIRFVGELFKLDLLTVNTMRSCIAKLLNDQHEDSYECLCKLLTTVGAKLETQAWFTESFKKIKALSTDRKISSRIRFMLEDVIELRVNKWVASRVGDTARPMTIEEVHEQARQDEISQQKQIAQFDDRRQPPSLSSRNSLGGVDRRRPLTSSMGSMGSRPLNLTSALRSPVMLKMGPGGGCSGWSSGSKGPKASASVPRASSSSSARPSLGLITTNSFSMLSQDDGDDGVSKSALVAAKSVPSAVHAAVSHSTSVPSTTASSQHQQQQQHALKGASDVSAECMSGRVRAMADELAQHKDLECSIEDCLLYLHERTVGLFVSQCVDRLLESTAEKRHLMGQLHQMLIERRLLTVEQYLNALSVSLQYMADLQCDIPTLWTNLAELLAPVLLSTAVGQPPTVTLLQLGGAAGHVRDAGCGPLMLRALLRRIIDLNGTGALRSLVPPKFDWSLFFGNSEDHVKVLSEWQMGYLAPGEPVPLPLTCAPQSGRVCRLVEEARARGVQLEAWMRAEKLLPPASDQEQQQLASDLLAALCFNSILASEGGQNVSESRLDQFGALLKLVVSGHMKRELAALDQLAQLWVHLHYPPLLLDRWFRVLCDLDVISDAAFIQWNKNQASCEGIGCAVASLHSFFDELQRVTAEDRT